MCRVKGISTQRESIKQDRHGFKLNSKNFNGFLVSLKAPKTLHFALQKINATNY